MSEGELHFSGAVRHRRLQRGGRFGDEDRRGSAAPQQQQHDRRTPEEDGVRVHVLFARAHREQLHRWSETGGSHRLRRRSVIGADAETTPGLLHEAAGTPGKQPGEPLSHPRI